MMGDYLHRDTADDRAAVSAHYARQLERAREMQDSWADKDEES